MADEKIFDLTELVKEEDTNPEKDPFLSEKDPFLKTPDENIKTLGAFDLSKELSLEEALFSQKKETSDANIIKSEISDDFSFTDDSANEAERKPVSEAQLSGSAINELKHELPVIIEKMLKPAIEEISNEVVLTVKKILPELVEKIIREEIEKLKKIQS